MARFLGEHKADETKTQSETKKTEKAPVLKAATDAAQKITPKPVAKAAKKAPKATLASKKAPVKKAKPAPKKK